MKIQTGHFAHHHHLGRIAESGLNIDVVDSFRETLALLGAVSAAIAIVMVSVWVTGTGMQSIFNALIWGLGLIFLAMAVDNNMSKAVLQLITGLSLLVLAGLQNMVSVDFTIAAGVVIALWIAATLFRVLK